MDDLADTVKALALFFRYNISVKGTVVSFEEELKNLENYISIQQYRFKNKFTMHVDIEPGDREADCGGIMEPIAVWVRGKGEWAIIHRCRRCGALSSNRVAADDNPMKLMSIALKPLCEPPFPLERIEEMTALMGGEGRLK